MDDRPSPSSSSLPFSHRQLFKEGLQRFSALHHRYGAGGERPWRRKVARSDMREFREAMRMLEDAAEQNNAEAQFNIGTIHAQGSVEEVRDTAGRTD